MNKKITSVIKKSFIASLALLVGGTLMAGSLALGADEPNRLFDDNSLIRGGDRKIFVVQNGERRQIKGLAELRRDFRGREIINVDDATLASIKLRTDNSGPGSINSNRGRSANSGSGRAIRNNDLIRSRDRKIFVIESGERRQVRNLAELRREHAGQVVRSVDDATLRRFPMALEDNPNRLFDDNRLLRDERGRIFVVEDNSLRRITDLIELRREHLGQAIHNVNEGVLLAGGVKLRGDGTVDDDVSILKIKGIDDFVNGVKLRGDGTVDDNLPRRSGLDDVVAGVKLRGDGTVDDNLPRHSGLDDSVGGVKLRGDGTVDDNSVSSGGGSSSDSSSSGGASSGGDSGSGRGGSGGGNSSDD